MERYEQEPSRRVITEETLGRSPYDKMLQFTESGFNLLGYEETSETGVRTIKFQALDIVSRFRISRLRIEGYSDDLEELLPILQDTAPSKDDRIFPEIDDEKFEEWKATLISPEDIQEACRTELERREVEGDEFIVDCVDCKGQPTHTSECLCAGGGIIFIDSTGEAGDEPVRLRDEGEVDPDCDVCEGTGEVVHSCLFCEGCGQSAKYPVINLVNAETGEERSITLDLVSLVANGDVEVIVSQSNRDYENGLKVARQSLVFRVADYIDKCIESIGIDKDNSVVIRGSNVFEVSTWRNDRHVGESSWRQENGEVRTGLSGSKEMTTPRRLLEEAQLRLSQSHNWQKEMIKNGDGVGVEEEWVMRPLRPFHESLEDLRTSLQSQGYALGYIVRSKGRDAGQPCFYMLDKDGSTVRILSDGRRGKTSIRISLENAWLEFQRMLTEEVND